MQLLNRVGLLAALLIVFAGQAVAQKSPAYVQGTIPQGHLVVGGKGNGVLADMQLAAAPPPQKSPAYIQGSILEGHLVVGGPTNGTLVDGGEPTYDALTQQYVAAGLSNGAPPMSTFDKRAIDALVTTLKGTGYFSSCDGFWLLAVADLRQAVINLCDPTGPFKATAVSSPAFIAYRGVAGAVGGSNGYLNTNLDPTTAPAAKYKRDDACMGGENLTNKQGLVNALGTSRASLRFLANAGANSASVTVQSTSTQNYVLVGNSFGDLTWTTNSATTYDVYQNGAPLATAAARAAGTLTSETFWIGRSNGGSQSTDKLIAGFWVGSHCSPAQMTAISGAMKVYLAAFNVTFPWGGDPIYVSKTAANGYPVGSDTTGLGTKDRPFLTLDQAYDVMNPGQQIICNDGTYQPGELAADSARTSFLFSSTARITSVTPLGCVIKGYAGFPILRFGAAGGTLTLDGIVLDGQNGTTDSLLALSDTATKQSLVLNQIFLKNPGKYGISYIGTATKTNITDNQSTCQLATAGRECVRLLLSADGDMLFDGVNYAATMGSIGNTIIDIEAVAVGPTVHITNSTLSCQAFNDHIGHNGCTAIQIDSISNALVEKNHLTLTSDHSDPDPTKNPVCLAIGITSGAAGLAVTNPRVVDNVVDRDCAGGGSIRIGQDGPDLAAGTPYLVSGGEVARNILYATPVDAAGALHAIEVGYMAGGTKVWGNYIDTTYYCFVIKGNRGAGGPIVVYSNLCRAATNKQMYNKASVVPVRFIGNTIDVVSGSGDVCSSNDNDGEQIPGDYTTLLNNVCLNRGVVTQFVHTEPPTLDNTTVAAAAGGNVINIGPVGAGGTAGAIVIGATVADLTTPAAIPAGTTITARNLSTGDLTLSNNIAAPGVGLNNQIQFGGGWGIAQAATNDYFAVGGLNPSPSIYAWEIRNNHYPTLAAWQAAVEPSARGVDPQFTTLSAARFNSREDAAAAYTLKTGSPLIGVGTNAADAPTNFLGVPWPLVRNIGAM